MRCGLMQRDYVTRPLMRRLQNAIQLTKQYSFRVDEIYLSRTKRVLHAQLRRAATQLTKLVSLGVLQHSCSTLPLSTG